MLHERLDHETPVAEPKSQKLNAELHIFTWLTGATWDGTLALFDAGGPPTPLRVAGPAASAPPRHFVEAVGDLVWIPPRDSSVVLLAPLASAESRCACGHERPHLCSKKIPKAYFAALDWESEDGRTPTLIEAIG